MEVNREVKAWASAAGKISLLYFPTKAFMLAWMATE